MNTKTCAHEAVICLNEYELIRKYRCSECNEVMMCDCDQTRGERFLPHQLSHGTELETQRRVPVTLGFQPKICRECRGLAPIAAPVASIPGRTSKIKRYYWREIGLRELELLAEAGVSILETLGPEGENLRKSAEEQAVREIKTLHERSPKYSFNEESEASFLSRTNVDIRTLQARVRAGGELVLDDETTVGPELFVMRALQKEGYSCMKCESVPFHALFAVQLWTLIQDYADPLVEDAWFGERSSFEENRSSSSQVMAALPEDFGTKGYSQRRAQEIDDFFTRLLPKDRDGLLFAFDIGLEGSYSLRQYLWAHREDDSSRARRLIEILPPDHIIRVLRYLVDDYWHNYIGWPDIVAWRGSEVLFAEIKLSADKLSNEQRRWIQANQTTLKFPFQLIKIHRLSEKSR